jgi:hypothetical protein
VAVVQVALGLELVEDLLRNGRARSSKTAVRVRSGRSAFVSRAKRSAL